MKKTKISKIIGRRGKIGLAVLVALMFIGVASAALLPYYGKITTTANVSQSVLIDGYDYTNPITNEFDVIGGCSKCFEHTLENQGCSDAPIDIVTTGDVEGISVEYMKRVPYSFDQTVKGWTFGKVQDPTTGIHMVVEEVGNWIQWTYTYPSILQAACVNIDYPLAETGKEICIHNNDGHDPTYAWGEWLYNPDGEQVGSGNTPVSELYWVQAEGERGTDDTMVVRILKSKINYDFHWHATYTPVGGPMYVTNFDGDSNYRVFYDADLWQVLPDSFTLGAGETLDIKICYIFDVAIVPRIYIITSLFQPAP